MITYRTSSGMPSGDITLQVSEITSTSAFFSWFPPTQPNGDILNYQLTSTSLASSEPQQHYTGLGLTSLVQGLRAYMNYTFQLSVCTVGGCLVSPGVEVITLEALPQGQGPPRVTALSQNQLRVAWDPPQFPNGKLVRVCVYWTCSWVRECYLLSITQYRLECVSGLQHVQGTYCMW